MLTVIIATATETCEQPPRSFGLLGVVLLLNFTLLLATGTHQLILAHPPADPAVYLSSTQSRYALKAAEIFTQLHPPSTVL